MTNEEIHNIYLHMTGKAEGLAEATGEADFPVMFAKAILEFDRMQRPWVGLTDEEVHQGFCHVEYETPNDWNTDPDDWCQQFARYLEAKLKEKNT